MCITLKITSCNPYPSSSLKQNKYICRMKYLLVLIVALPLSLFAQKKKEPFIGKLVYMIEIDDTNFRELYPPKQMVVYTDDTITRIENMSDQLGKQVLLKHMVLNKSYLLIETPNQNFAIKTDFGDEAKKPSKYSFKKKMGKRKIGGVRANRLVVTHPDMKSAREFLYLKEYSPKYINAFEELPGLPVQYYIITEDGVFKYTLKSIEIMTPDHDLFGIPSDFKKVTIEEFMDYILQENQPE